MGGLVVQQVERVLARRAEAQIEHHHQRHDDQGHEPQQPGGQRDAPARAAGTGRFGGGALDC